MKNYLDLLEDIMVNGDDGQNRTGVLTREVFGRQMRFDLNKGFPLVTTKKVSFPNIAHELIWFLQGSTNIAYLHENNVHIWDEWADVTGSIGPLYGEQWRRWPIDKGMVADQIAETVATLQEDPDSRRIVVSAWNTEHLPYRHLSPKENATMGRMALAPCHCLFQFAVGSEGLSCMVTIRSSDVFLGLPYNIASYALLTHIIAGQVGMNVDSLVVSLGCTHIYHSHFDVVTEQLIRAPRKLPRLEIAEGVTVDNVRYEDLSLIGYSHYSALKAEIAV